MGGVYLGEGKNGGEDTFAVEGHANLRTPLQLFLAASLSYYNERSFQLQTDI